MAERVVVWTKTAMQQRRAILFYWTKRNGSTAYAERLISLIAKQLKIIVRHPQAFPLAQFPSTHTSVLGYYSIYYKILHTKLSLPHFGTIVKTRNDSLSY